MHRKRHILALAALLGLSCLVQTVVIRRATTTALDAVRFVRIAQRMDQGGLLHAMRTEREQPLFPASIRAVHGIYAHLVGESRTAWADSAQLAAAIPLVLAIVPLYFSILRSVGARAAVAGSFFFCLLPEVSRLGADGISDSTHLFFFCVAFWAMVEYFAKDRDPDAGGRKGSAWWLTLSGIATALAALARVEVLVLAAALGVAMAAFQLRATRRVSWKPWLWGTGGYVFGLAVVFGPYLAAVDARSPRAAIARVLGRADVESSTAEAASAVDGSPDWRLDNGEPASFDEKERSVSIRQRGFTAAIVRFARKLARAFGYWIGALALFGAWRLRRRGVDRLDRFVQIFFLLFSLLAFWFSAVEGYLEPRHLLLLVVVGMGSAGHGAWELGAVLPRLLPVKAQAHRAPAGSRAGVRPAATRMAVVLIAGWACLPWTLSRRHDGQLGHRAAAEWLASREEPCGNVLDTRGWTGLYSGRKTYAYTDAAAVLCDPQLAYLVLQRDELHQGGPRSRTLRWLIETAGERVAEFPDPATREPDQPTVLVYRWDAARFRRHVSWGTFPTCLLRRGTLETCPTLESLCVNICAPCAHVRRTDLWSVATDQRSVLRVDLAAASPR